MKLTEATEQLSHQFLLGYTKIKINAFAEVEQIIDATLDEISQSEAKLIDQAGWLWLFGEYVEKSKQRLTVKVHEELVTSIINRIAINWSSPDLHWLSRHSSEQDIYLSQVAYYYAALRSASFIRVSDLALMTMKHMRDYLFANFMDGISMVNKKGGHEVTADMVLATVPFGYFTPGDLALMKAFERIDEAKLSGEEAAWFSWYYSECGNLVKARLLLEQARLSLTDDSIWFRAASTILSVHEYSEDILFEHLPQGYECPYISDVNERYPRQPLVGDEVTVQVVIRSKEAIDSVKLMYQIDEHKVETVEMTKVEQANIETYYVGKIGTASSTANVQYEFEAINEAGVSKRSARYSYTALKWLTLEALGGVERELETIVYYCAKDDIHYAKLTKLTHESDSFHYRFTALTKDQLVSQFSEEGTLLKDLCLPSLSVLTDGTGVMSKLRFSYNVDDQALWYGMGERFASLTFSECELDNFVYNQYKDQGYRTYIPVPLAISTAQFGLFLDSTLYSLFRFGTTESDMLEIEANLLASDMLLNWYTLNGSATDQLRQYTQIIGKPKLPPKWAFGPWMSSNNWDSEKETLFQLEQNKKYAIPATVIVLEQWSDEATFYIFNDAQYEAKEGKQRFEYTDFKYPEWGRWPDPKGLVERIHKDGLKLLLWQAPVMKYMEGVAHTQRDADANYMLEKSYGVKNEDGTAYQIPSFEWFRGSYVPDFTYPEAAKWWFEKRQYLLDEIGIDGFKTDGGECIYGSQTQFYDGRTGAQMRNEYPNTYVGAFHQFANQYVEGGAITFSRAGYTGAQLIPMHWAGDERSTFEAFQASIRAGLSAGLSGISFWGWDFGGFSGEIPTAELYIRGTQMATFCPVMQYHAESKGQFNMDRTPWNIAERTGEPQVLAIYKYYADLRMNLLPYIYSEAEYSAVTGEPLMRAHLLDYPQDVEAIKQEHQYMFGRSLLVIPVTVEGATSILAYFPEGQWLPFLDDESVAIQGGAYVEVATSIDKMPVYIKENKVVALNVNDSLTLGSHVGNEWQTAEHMLFVAYVTTETSCTYKDDQLELMLDISWQQGKLQINYDLKGAGKAYVCLKQAPKLKELATSDQVLTEVSYEHNLTISSYMYRHSDLLITLEQGQHSIVGK